MLVHFISCLLQNRLGSPLVSSRYVAKLFAAVKETIEDLISVVFEQIVDSVEFISVHEYFLHCLQ